MTSLAFLYTTMNDLELAENLAAEAVKTKLAACVNILPQAISVYAWEGQVEKSHESLLLFKTTTERLKDLETWLKSKHPYEVPAIISSKVDSSEDFFDYVHRYVLSSIKAQRNDGNATSY